MQTHFFTSLKQASYKIFMALMIVTLSLAAMPAQATQARPQAAISVSQAWVNATNGTNTDGGNNNWSFVFFIIVVFKSVFRHAVVILSSAS